MDELEAADAEIMRMWQPGSHVGRNKSQWDELRKLALERKEHFEGSQGKTITRKNKDGDAGITRSHKSKLTISCKTSFLAFVLVQNQR